ncbi:hypothetical protein [Rhizobium laguerreae]|uniref:hypothetical protein n=1 Tax=Rhizobium laguerreae TaxID=1076926 RepID=UPI001C92B0DF|nr:hypothetical protein [Rhizobium laguerreae]MBY3122574.1 hypothetical protein [Rhizobium laguerreae]MBY3488875.1 hypothetical protein [Rhizobium laguerreae]
MSQTSELPTPKRIGSDGMHYFFGYYNKSNWDRTGRYILAHQVPWADHKIEPHLVARVGYFDSESNDFNVLGETSAWNWQMGAQLQWLDHQPGRKIIYNARAHRSDHRYPGFGSIIRDIESGDEHRLPLPIYVVAPNSQWALSVNYRRLWITHQTIGYPEVCGAEDLRLHPADDGIYRMEIESGSYELVVSYQALRDFHPRNSMDKAIHWVSHIEVNPSSSRILFLHRWTERVADETCFLHRLITANPDGSDLRLLECSDHPLPQLASDFDPASVGTFAYEKSEYQISHPLWKDDQHVIVWGPHAEEIHYHLYQDRPEGVVEVIGRDILTENGHMSFSPQNPRWMISDTYPDPESSIRDLFLFDTRGDVRIPLGGFYTSPDLGKENRCDLHPRWKRDGSQVCIDSIHDGERRLYTIDVSKITQGYGP